MLVVPLPTPVWGHFKAGEATYRFLTQRQCPSLARVSVKIVDRQLLFCVVPDGADEGEKKEFAVSMDPGGSPTTMTSVGLVPVRSHN